MHMLTCLADLFIGDRDVVEVDRFRADVAQALNHFQVERHTTAIPLLHPTHIGMDSVYA